ncbi:hypothetical protein KXD40_004930 [Peronospora effusa]|uniref:FH2 domain-containing protein n=1 Tax=Peronospora effusa TaxID=542832 RepID=A0A425CDH3_9STRA|nr:hypothetical protein DD237_006738 [Peronospora effusa]UIZ22243.1 hypothetical protein KXD40_004930 [Peronospora effusa]
MERNGNYPVYAGLVAVDCNACHLVLTSDSWLILHFLMSFILVAYVRWSRVTIHNHACNDRELPVCCRRRLQQHHIATKPVKEMQEKEKTVSVLSAEERLTAARLIALRSEYATYLQMLKVGLPRVIVDHKIRAEKKDPVVLDELLAMTLTAKKVPAPIEIPQPVEKEDPEHTQKVEFFQRMIKVGVPRHVVEMKARKEGVEPTELDKQRIGANVVLKRTDVSEVSASTELGTRSRRSSISSVISTAPSTPDALAARSAATSNGRTLAMLAIRKMNNGMRKKLHWSTTPYTGAIVPAQRDSLWSRIHAKAPQDGVCISSESRRWMEKLFVKAVAKAKASQIRRATSANNMSPRKQTSSQHFQMKECERANIDPAFFDDEQDEMESEPEPVDEEMKENGAEDSGNAFLRRKLYVVLLDHKKSQNIAIVLARVKRSFSELTHEILTLNCNVLSSPALQSLIDMWPDSAEQEAINQFDGDVLSLATAEQFLMVARKVPRAQQKLRCLQFKMDFTLRVEELRDNLSLLIRGIQQVCSSDRFAGVLEYIFHLGNLLNFGEGVEYTEWVKSISISSLGKLAFTKAYNGRISFLQFVVQSVERDEPHLAQFSDELPLIVKCSKLSAQSLVAEYQSLKGGLRMLINETQKTAVLKTDDDELRADLAQSRESMRLFTMEVEQVLNVVQKLVDQLEQERKNFLNYFEEEDTLPIDEVLGFIASFAEEYSRERHQLFFSARRAQQASRLPQKRHSL